MDRLLHLLATTPTPEARRAVGEASTIILVVALVGIILVCGVVLLALRRRTREAAEPRTGRGEPPASDAWTESGRRVPLEDDDEIPREPGTA